MSVTSSDAPNSDTLASAGTEIVETVTPGFTDGEVVKTKLQTGVDLNGAVSIIPTTLCPGKGSFPDADCLIKYGAEDLFLLFGKGVRQSGDTAATCVLSGPAQKWKEAQIKDIGFGHFDGLATTSRVSLVSFPSRVNPPLVDYQTGAITASDLNFPLQSIENYIGYYFQTQSLWPVLDHEFKVGPKDIVNQLITDFSKPTPVAYTLAIFKMPGYKEGHSIAPYGVETVNATESRIIVYDNNFPKQRQYITVDMAANTWRYVTASTPGEPSDVYFDTASGKTSGGLSILPTNAGLRAAATGMVAGTLTFQSSGEGAILVENDEGQATGYAFDIEEDINEIPDAELFYFKGELCFDVLPRIKVPFFEADDTLYSVFISGKKIDDIAQGSLTITGAGFAIGVNDVNLVPDEFFEFKLNPDGDHISFTATETGETPRHLYLLRSYLRRRSEHHL
ncbi:hypothetical protein DO021_18185 [Desulfobacter hydrogenophilus]|uniref:Uncharacterized protein n=1 Tax=Desulfobacter hydrogenophilus TaxID=2291 RepID=A0A328FC18_9BACT|nr:hypothetical protein [Desulfobacter hydrogenophilus]NDY73639.1 hypothetical protein [Desulfobacter hydrogenophilus]QBH14918.1 hypothetical protein EYB58_19550 [Desulfobacter hydrogenophilus]RAM00577.1 hypothetical protein DO021_18185 [Desulfobacter hydrogenophilus]